MATGQHKRVRCRAYLDAVKDKQATELQHKSAMEQRALGALLGSAGIQFI